MKQHLALVAMFFALTGVAAAQYVPVVPPPPAGNNQASHALFDAMLSISRATLTNPAAAQTATFSYNQAIQRYNAGDLTAARAAALQAQSEAARPPVATATPPAIVLPETPLARTPLIAGANVAQIDADQFLALTRGTLQNCGSNPKAFASAGTLYMQALREYHAGQYQAVRRDARDAIDRCAATNAAHP